MADLPDLLTDLTKPQREAVLCTEGPLLVLAGPGSGKTRVITRRIAHLISMGVPAWQILAVTFTNKAAGEMRHRVASLIGEGPITRGLTVTTFHSLCVRLLRRYVELWRMEAGGTGTRPIDAPQHGQAQGGREPVARSVALRPPPIKADFTVFDADDQAALMKKVLAALELSTSNWPPRSMLSAVSSAKNELIDHEAYARSAGDFHSRTVARVYERYDQALRAAGAVDFDDLLLMTAKMLRESSAVREEVRRRYRYLLIDEYQDTNKSQFVIANLIAGEEGGNGNGEHRQDADATAGGTPMPRPNICVVGDPDQSIYGWRGADIANILQFEEHYPSARVIALGENFRSLAPILNAADRLIRQNKRRKHKPLIAMRRPPASAGGSAGNERGNTPPATAGGSDGGSAENVEITLCRDEHHEAALVLDWMKLQREAGTIEWKDAAVFYRTNALSRVIEDTLRNAGVPYTIVRGTAFYQREEVRNALGYLRVVANPADSVSLARIINTPSRGIGDSTWEKIESAAAQRGVTGTEMIRSVRELPGIPARSLNAVEKFATMLDSWSPRASTGAAGEMFGGADAAVGGLAELVSRVVRESGLEQMYATEEERVENLAELVSSAREFEESYRGDEDGEPDTGIRPDDAPGEDGAEGGPETRGTGTPLLDLLHAYLERVALVADTDALDPSQGAVTLMTLHAAKGLEYKAVALIGLEEAMLPHMRSQESEAALEEERRLCFVGITRAMDRLMLTSSKFRTLRGIAERMIPSRFIDELRGDGVSISDQSGGMSGFDGDPDVEAFLSRGGGGGRFDRPARGGGDGTGERVIVPDNPRSVAGFWIGSKVRHPQFGVGTVEAVSGGMDARVRVKFREVGVKTLVLAYARLERVQ